MKFFLDTANIDEIKKAADLGILDGVTTNPSLVAKEKKPFEELVYEICEIVNGPVSAEVVSTDFESMVEEARKLAAVHEHVVVKIPLIREGIKAVTVLSKEDIRTNVTRANRVCLVWSLSPQGEMNRFVSRSNFDRPAATEL